MSAFVRLLRIGHWLPIDRLKAQARSHAQRVCERWDVPRGKDVKPDLRDVRGRYMLTRDGFRVSGLLLDSEMQQGSDSPAVPLLLAALPVLAALHPLMKGALGDVGELLLALLISVPALLIASSIGFIATLAALAFGVVLPITVGFMGGAGALHGVATGLLLSSPFVVPVLVLCIAVGFFIRNPLWHAASIGVAAVAAIGAADFVLAGFAPGLAGAVWWAIACAVPLGFAFSRWLARDLALANQGNRATIASVAPLTHAHIEARASQAERAKNDSTPFLQIGTARGIFTAKQDPYSPDEGLVFGLTVADLDVHTTVFGSTGTGKTTGILKVLAASYLGWSTEASRQLAEGAIDRLVAAGGIVILDGKGSLAGDFRGLKDYLLIEPGKVQLGLLEGLEPTDVVLAFQTVNQPKSETGSGKFFTTAASEMLRHLAVFLRALVDVEIAKFGRDGERTWHWTLHDLHSLGLRAQRGNKATADKMDTYLDTVKERHPNGQELVGVVGDAIEYLKVTMPGMDGETRANIWMTLLGWITPAMSHPALLPWAHVEFGVSLDRVFFGGAVGINTPRFTYGIGGTLVQALVKQRLFVHIRRRASYDWAARESRVMFLIDEAQEIVGAEDREMLPVARSLGAICVYATQNIENYIVRLGGQHEANGFLDCFQSFFSYKSSPATAQWVQQRLGQTVSLVPLTSGGHVAYEQNARLAAESPMNDPNHEGARLFRLLSRQGAGGTSVLHRGKGLMRHGSAEGLSLDKLALTTGGATNAEFKMQPLLLDSEFDAYTAEKFCCVAQVQRGGVRRRDVIRTKPMFVLPPELVGTDKDETAPGPELGGEAPEIREVEPIGESTAARVRTSQALRDEPGALSEAMPESDASATFEQSGDAGTTSPKP